MKDNLEIFDIDGTITMEGCDLWFETTKALVTDDILFNSYLKQWNQDKKLDPLNASLEMMEKALKLMSGSTTSETIDMLVRKITNNYFKNGKIREEAIEQVNEALTKGNNVIFSSTNYEAGAKAFVDTLFELKLINESFRPMVHVSGTQVDFGSKKIEHFNMGGGKVDALSRRFSYSINNLKNKALAAYGDDPLGNDSGILGLAKKAFVVTTAKNLNIHLPQNFERVYWQ